MVDGLRGLAAIGVMIYHAVKGGHVTLLLRHLPDWLVAALGLSSLRVAVFFVLSGFVISHSVYDDRVTPGFFGRFMLRRTIRLYPVYLLGIVLTIAFSELSARIVPGHPVPVLSLGQIVAHLFYLQEILNYDEINVVFWTLTFELQFYLFFVLLLALTRNDPDKPFQGRTTAMVLGAAAVLSLLWPTGIFNDPPAPGLSLPLWFGFLLGVGACWSWKEPRLVPWFLGYAGIITLAGLWREDAFAATCGIAGVVMMLAARSGAIFRALDWRWLQFIGMISYSIYLTHNPITGAMFRIGFMMTGDTPMWETIWWGVSLAVCVLFATAVWWLIEQPSMALARKVPLRPRRDTARFTAHATPAE